MNVVFATYDDSPPEGGQGVYVRDLRGALEARGVSVRTVSGRGDHAMAYRRMLHRAPLDFSLALTRDPSALLTPRPDVVHAQGGPGGVLLLRSLPVPLVYTAHHTYVQAYPSRTSPQRALAPLERRAYAHAGMVLAVSPSTADAVRRMGIARIEVVPPGVDVAHLGARGESLREPALLLFVGRLEPAKQPLHAVAVMRRLAAERMGVRGIVAGRGSLDAQVRAAASESGGAVQVLGAVSDDELRDLYARAAVLLAPSRYEGLGLVALEAAAAGAAVVAYDVTGLRDAVAAAGVLVPAGDVDAMAAAARRLLDPAQRSDLAARGRAWVAEHHSWEACATQVEAAYQAVAEQGAGPQPRG